jgi:hypothetical protein
MDDIRTTWHDHGAEGAVIARQGLVGGVVDMCKELHNSGTHGSKDVKHLASVPRLVVEHYCTVNGVTLAEFMRNKDHIKRLLNDPAFADFRVWPGQV